MSREACPYISERFAAADGTAFDAGAKDENGHMLAGVVGAVPCWIIAMVGGDHRDIPGRIKANSSGSLASKVSRQCA